MDYIHPLEKSAIQGAITGLATCVYYGSKDQGKAFGYTTRLCYIGGGVGTITSIVNDVVHSFVKEEVPINS